MTILVIEGPYEQIIRLLMQEEYQDSVFLYEGPAQYTFCEMPEEADFPLKKYTLYLKNNGNDFAYKVLNPRNEMVQDRLTENDIPGLARWFKEAPALTDIGLFSRDECKKIFEVTAARGHTSSESHYHLCEMPDDDAKLECNKLYLKKIDQAFKYKVLSPEDKLFEGRLTASDVPELDRWFKPMPPLEGIKNLSSLSYQILKLTCTRGHTVKNEGEEAAHMQIVKDVTDRLKCLVGNKENLEVLVAAWLTSQGSSNTYIQGSADARIFSSSLSQWKNDLTPFILRTQDEVSRNFLFRLISEETGFAYLVPRTVEEVPVEGGAVKQTVIKVPAAVSIFCEPKHPDIWMQFYMKPPPGQADVPLSQRQVTILMPSSLGSKQILSAQIKGLSVKVIESLQDVCLDEIIENHNIRAIVESVFEEDVCCLERLALLDNRAAGFCNRHKHPMLRGASEFYYNFETLLSMLAHVDVSGYRDVLVHAQQAAQALKDSPTFKKNLQAVATAFFIWQEAWRIRNNHDIPEEQKKLREFIDYCQILVIGPCADSDISRGDVDRAMIFLAAQYPYYREIADRYTLCLLPDTAIDINLEPWKIYLKFKNTRKDSLVYYCLDPLEQKVTTNNIIRLENLSAETVFPETLSEGWLNSISSDLLRCLADRKQVAEDACFVKELAKSLLTLLQELKNSLPWVAEMTLDASTDMVLPLDVFNTGKYPLPKPPYFLSDLVVERVRTFLVSSKDFRTSLADLSQAIEKFKLLKDLVLPEAFLKHCQDVVEDGHLEDSHKSLRFIITHYSTWHSMTLGIEYPKKIQDRVAELLPILRQALWAREELRDGRVVLRRETVEEKTQRFEASIQAFRCKFHRLPGRRIADDMALSDKRDTPAMRPREC